MNSKISDSIKENVVKIVGNYNKVHNTEFVLKCRGKFAYLSKMEIDEMGMIMEMLTKSEGLSKINPPVKEESKVETKLARLTYQGKMDNWLFDPYRYSNERYDDDAFMYPGWSDLDGTIEGALKAAAQLYP